MNKWFINSDNFIKGPFSSDEVQQHINTLGDESQNTFLWSRGYSEWVRADKWSPQDESAKKAFVPATPTSKKTDSVDTDLKTNIVENIKNASVEKFRVQYDFTDRGEMTKEQLTQFTARQEDVSRISVFDKKNKEWKDIYSYPDIVNKLGISRRKTQRVPILAQFTGTTLNSQKITARVITVSEGGLGLTDNFDLKLGDSIQGQITSPHFYSPLTITAEVTYAGLDGYVGLKFINLSDEGYGLITDYIKRFGKAES